MQSVNAAFTAEEKDTVRKIADSLLVSWHRQLITNNRTFTIGVSTIGGNNSIAVSPGAIGSPGNYKYFDESTYVTSLGWERGYNMPTGGLTKALAEAELDNTSGRFTPRYMGGNSEISTAIQTGKPSLINAGFNFGVDITLPQFSGVISEQPEVSIRNKTVHLKMADYIEFFQNKYLDQVLMFTNQFTDQVLATLSAQLGMNTAQYDYDRGINLIPFGLFDVGTKFSDIFNELVEAENGHFYQDESGVFKFENRQHWDSSPYNQVQRVIYTSEVIEAQTPNLDHLINVVEVKSQVRSQQASQIVYTLPTPLALNGNSTTDLFVSFSDPVVNLITPTIWLANTLQDGTGNNITAFVTLTSISKFAQSAKLTFTNSGTSGYLTSLNLYGSPAKVLNDIYYRASASRSITAFNEHPLLIQNDYIPSQSWAKTYAQMILNDFSQPENIQTITIRAMPELQLGDLISWQGHYWRIYDIKSILDASSGFIQELRLLQRNIVSYFRIGVSTIGGTAKISP